MTVIHMPMDYSDAEYIDLSAEDGYFWKQLIPMGYELDYKGRKLKFDKHYLSNIKTAFEENALGQQTAFQLATDANEHDTDADKLAGRHYDPKRFQGDVEQLAINNRGLYGKFKLTKDGTKIISDNPRLGVSVSLKEGFKSHDGKTYPVVMRHVLGTLDPKIRDMGDWQKDYIALSETYDDKSDEEVIDLTAPGATETKQPADTQTPTADGENVTVKKSDYEKMQQDLQEYQDAEKEIESWLEEDDDDDTVDQAAPVDPKLIELSNQVAASQWEAERDKLLRKGVPVKMLDLATEVMSDGYSDYTIQLSNEKTVDSKDLIRKLLHEAEGAIDLSEEQGHGVSNDEGENEARDQYIENFMRDLF
jgi:hypothetical protein